MKNSNDDRQLEIDVSDYWLILKKRAAFGLCIFFLVLATVFVYSYRQVPVYQSSCIIKVSARQPVAEVMGTKLTLFAGSQGLSNEIKNISNKLEMHEKILKRLKIKAAKEKISAKALLFIENLTNARVLKNMLFVSEIAKSNQLSISYTGPYPEFTKLACQSLAEIYAEDFALNKTLQAKETVLFIEKQLKDKDNKIRKIQQQINKLTDEQGDYGDEEILRKKMTTIRLQIFALQNKYTGEHPAIIKLQKQLKFIEEELKKIPNTDVNLTTFLGELKTLATVKATIHEQLINASINKTVLEGKAKEEVQLINPPIYGVKIAPNFQMNIILGIILGVIIGCVSVFVLEGLDTSIGKIEDVEKITGLPVIAQIPVIGTKKNKWLKFGIFNKESERDLEDKLLFNYDGKSVVYEAYRSLRTNFHFAMGKKNNMVIAVTSSSPREGKTLTATNLAITLAGMGKMTLLIEADMRKPQIANLFKIEENPGLSDLLIGTASKQQAVRNFTDILMGDTNWDKLMEAQGIDLLSVLPCGTIPYHPTELLSSNEFKDALNDFKQIYDYIIIDTPPVLPVADSIIISSVVDGMIIIYQSDQTSRHLLMRTIQNLRKNNAPILGTVINQLSFDVTLKDTYKGYY